MEFLGIGPLELLLIILVALLVLGPKEMEKMSKTVGRNLNKLIKSDVWKDIQSTSEKVKNLPTELMRNAELEELDKSLHTPLDDGKQIAAPLVDNKIAPPRNDENKAVIEVKQGKPAQEEIQEDVDQVEK